MSAATPAMVAVMALLGVLLSGCETTQSKSARLAREASVGPQQRGLAIGSRNSDVTVRESAVVSDENGAAVALVLANRSARAQAGVPLLLDVRGGDGASLFRNDAPGLERSLTHAPLVPARGEALWINDQIPAAGTARSAEVVVGAADDAAAPVTLRAGTPRLEEDPLSGVAAVGLVTNPGDEDVRRALIAIVARRGAKVVAAGRGVVPRVPAGRRARYKVFFIGDPRGARLQVGAQAPERRETP